MHYQYFLFIRRSPHFVPLSIAILGATGYSGLELVRLLKSHSGVESPLLLQRAASSGKASPADLAEVFPELGVPGQHPLTPFSWKALADAGTKLLLLATPHELSRTLVPEALARGLRVIDLSGAWRLQQLEHEAVYGFTDADTAAVAAVRAQSVYGLPELNAARIADARLVANPGCYATSVILALAPLLRTGVVDLGRDIIADVKSGVTGAGKEPRASTHFVSVADNLSAYGVFTHRHLGEICEQLSITTSQLTFTPHLLPIPRGILSTIYVTLREPVTQEQVLQRFASLYAGQPLVRIFPPPQLPQIRYSVHTNFCDIGFCIAPDGHRLVIISCLDNLRKGAASQAIQNMNLMYGWPQSKGLL